MAHSINSQKCNYCMMDQKNQQNMDLRMLTMDLNRYVHRYPMHPFVYPSKNVARIDIESMLTRANNQCSHTNRVIKLG